MDEDAGTGTPRWEALVVEPDRRLAHQLVSDVRDAGFDPIVVHSGGAAMLHVEGSQPDLVLARLDLPDLDVVELCRRLRLWTRCPIVIVTDRPDERVVAALDHGADDFVVTPYDAPILHAKMRVALRHSEAIAGSAAADVIECGDVRLDLDAHQAIVGDVPIDLQPRQLVLLATLMRNAGQLVSHARLARVLWGDEVTDGAPDRLRSAISGLRKTLGRGPRRPVIVTATSVGYRLVPPA